MIRLILALLLGTAVPATADDRLTVVTTLPSLGSVAREIGGDRVEVTALAKAGEDPHFLEPKPSFMVKLRDADLFIVNGLDLEVGWVPPLLEGARNGKIQPGAPGYLDASSSVTVIDIPRGPVDRSMGDVHPFGNPHYMSDPLAVRSVAGAVAERLAAIDPAGSEKYAANRKAYERKLDEAMFGKDLVEEVGGGKLARLTAADGLNGFLAEHKLEGKLGGWVTAMKNVKGKEVVPFHPSLNYFLARFGLRVAGTIEAKPGISPSSGQVQKVITLVTDRKVKVLLRHPWNSESATDSIAEKTGARVVTVPLEDEDALHLVETLVKDIGGALK